MSTICYLVDGHKLRLDSAVSSWACLKVPGRGTSGPDTAATEPRCVDRVNTVRLFFDDLELWNNINCSGLLALRRLVSISCCHEACTHPPSYPAAFEWMFPLVQPEIETSIPSIGKTFARLLQTGMSYSNTTPLEQLISTISDINTNYITKWFSPAHFIASPAFTAEYQNAAKLLITKGINLHLVPDEEHMRTIEYESIRGQSPTALALRYSTLFFQFKSLLNACNVDIDAFVIEELKQKPLAEAGWTQTTLRAMFDLEFQPSELPRSTCNSDRHKFKSTIWSYGHEPWWEVILFTMRNIVNEPCDIQSLLSDSAKTIAMETWIQCKFCYQCHMLRYQQQCSWEDSESSPFLFPTEILGRILHIASPFKGKYRNRILYGSPHRQGRNHH